MSASSSSSPINSASPPSFAEIASTSCQHQFSENTSPPNFQTTSSPPTLFTHGSNISEATKFQGFSRFSKAVADSTGSPSLVQGGGKKRAIHEDVDDILGQICSRMNTLSTSDSKDDMIAAFISVLNCSHNDATFFLESAVWNVEMAVHLWLESESFRTGGLNRDNVFNDSYRGDQAKRSRPMKPESDKSDASSVGAQSREGEPSSLLAPRSSSGLNGFSINNGYGGGKKSRHPYIGRVVNIEGLDPDWIALVSRRTGVIYFLHTPTGQTQSAVPPGFADAETDFGDSSGANLGEDAQRTTSVGNNEDSQSEMAEEGAAILACDDENHTLSLSSSGGCRSGASAGTVVSSQMMVFSEGDYSCGDAFDNEVVSNSCISTSTPEIESFPIDPSRSLLMKGTGSSSFGSLVAEDGIVLQPDPEPEHEHEPDELAAISAESESLSLARSGRDSAAAEGALGFVAMGLEASLSSSYSSSSPYPFHGGSERSDFAPTTMSSVENMDEV